MHIYLLLFSSSSLTSVVLNCKTSFIMISIVVVFLCFVFFFFSCCHAVDTILAGHSIQDGQIITSSEETFALGFFSLGGGDESRNRYVGIWYNKISVQTVVWVANRENPIQDRSGNLIIGRDGNLVVLDGTGRSLWSTNVSNVSSNSSVILRDSGNLLLCDDRGCNPGKPLWQSFDEPTDTYLPGMRVGLNPRSNKDYFTSWKSETDPSRGNFSLGVDPQGSAEIIIWEGSRKLWRSGLWNAQIFIGVPNMTANILYGFNLVRDRGAAFFTYTVHNSADTVRFRVRWDGKEEQLLWNEGRKEWTTFWSQPTRDCEHYNRCGNFGICGNSNSQLCSCLRGFEPASRTDWDNGNWTGGCVRSTELQCDRTITSAGGGEGDRDRFFEMDGVKLPDFSISIPTNRDNCARMCLNNCSCKAYAYVSGIQCLTWSQDFVDIQKFEEGGQTLYIRLAASELGTSKNKLTLVIVLVVVLGAIFIICTTAYIFWRCRGKSGCLRKEPVIVDETKSREFWREFTAHEEPVNPAANGPELPIFSLQDIVTATNNFSIANKLGEGGFGPVFKGKLPCGKEVAVKRLSRKSGQGLEEFKNEIILIAKLQHRNLVRLLGYCVEGEEKILLYEYLPNKSLDTFIFANTKEQLNWRKRLNIIEGIARGLLYLHRDSRLRIIHRDLKVSNILLDAEMNPKISDFGMAKIFGGNENEGNTNRVVGTYGYMAPEYAMEGLFSVKSDVYSFGVLLLEIVSGKRNQFRHADYSMNLIGYAWNLWGEERAIEFVDPSIRDSCSDQSSVMRCINVGLLCVQDSPNDRLVMSTVVRMLESDTAILPTPRQPTFTMGRSPMKLESSTDCSEVLTSPNNMTNTMVVGR